MDTKQETERLTTIKFAFPTLSLQNVKNMRLINNELILYVNKSDVDNVSKTFTNMQFNLIDRVYKVHVSTSNKDTFVNAFGNIKYEVSPASNDNRFIVSITTNDENEYRRLLEIGNDEKNKCRVRPYQHRLRNTQNVNNTNNTNTENKKNNRPLSARPKNRFNKTNKTN